MAVGASSNEYAGSYLAFGREQTFGTIVTATASLDFLSFNMTTMKELKIHEEVSRSRTMARHSRLGKVIEGEVESYFYPQLNSCNYLLHQAFGGAITSATATGETAGGAGYSHTYAIGDHNQTYTSLSVAVRRGDSSTGKVFNYSGVKVNELSFAAEIDEALKISVSFIGKDSTSTATDYESALDLNTDSCLNFDSGRFSIEGTFASLTASSYWHVQNINFTLSNNLKGDAESRRIGSDTLDVLPPGMASFEMTTNVRFDTTTAFDAMINDTQYAGEFEFLGKTLTGSNQKAGIKLQFPKLFISSAPEPEISGPDGVLQSEITWTVLRDVSSAGGYACQAIVTNLTANYN